MVGDRYFKKDSADIHIITQMSDHVARFHVVDPWGNQTATSSYNMAMTEIKDVAEDLVQDFIKERLIKAQGSSKPT